MLIKPLPLSISSQQTLWHNDLITEATHLEITELSRDNWAVASIYLYLLLITAHCHCERLSAELAIIATKISWHIKRRWCEHTIDVDYLYFLSIARRRCGHTYDVDYVYYILSVAMMKCESRQLLLRHDVSVSPSENCVIANIAYFIDCNARTESLVIKWVLFAV